MSGLVLTARQAQPVILWAVLALMGCAATSAPSSDPATAVTSGSSEHHPASPTASQEAATHEAPASPAIIGSATGEQPSDVPATPATATPKDPAGSADGNSYAGAERACLQYEPQPVVLHGVIQRVTFPGPPNYESVAKGDTPETCWLLKLDQPACVDASPGDEIDVAYSKIQRVQLVLDGEAYERYRKLVGQRVDALGELFGSNTGHHHTEVLLTVRELRPASRRQR